jgi:hypothetical protein
MSCATPGYGLAKPIPNRSQTLQPLADAHSMPGRLSGEPLHRETFSRNNRTEILPFFPQNQENTYKKKKRSRQIRQNALFIIKRLEKFAGNGVP